MVSTTAGTSGVQNFSVQDLVTWTAPSLMHCVGHSDGAWERTPGAKIGHYGLDNGAKNVETRHWSY